MTLSLKQYRPYKYRIWKARFKYKLNLPLTPLESKLLDNLEERMPPPPIKKIFNTYEEYKKLINFARLIIKHRYPTTLVRIQVDKEVLDELDIHVANGYPVFYYIMAKGFPSIMVTESPDSIQRRRVTKQLTEDVLSGKINVD